MDILDQLTSGNKTQFSKSPPPLQKQKQFQSQVPHPILQTPHIKQSSPQKPLPPKQHQQSTPYFTSIQHYSISNSLQKINEIGDRDNRILRDKQHKNGKQKVGEQYVGIGLGEGRLEGNNGMDQRDEIWRNNWKRRNTLQEGNSNIININSNTVPIQQYQQIKAKLAKATQQNQQLHQQITNYQQTLQQKQQQLSKVNIKLDNQYITNKQNEKYLCNEQIKLYQKQINKLNLIHQEQLNRIQSTLQWTYKIKQNVLMEQISTLKICNEKYIMLGRKQGEIIQEKCKINQIYQIKFIQQQQQNLKIQSKIKSINQKQHNIQQQINKFYKQCKQFNNQKQQIKKQLAAQQSQLKKKKQQLVKQYQQKSLKLKQTINLSMKQFQQKQNKLQLQIEEIAIMRKLVQKQKQNNLKFKQQIIDDYQNKMEKFIIDKQKVYQKEAELINKINVVELYAQQYQNLSKKNNQQVVNIQPNQQSGKFALKSNTNIPQMEQLNQQGSKKDKSTKKFKNNKQNVSDYLQKLEQTSKTSKIGNRRIYKLQQYYK